MRSGVGRGSKPLIKAETLILTAEDGDHAEGIKQEVLADSHQQRKQ
jgi:hypothetical protein